MKRTVQSYLTFVSAFIVLANLALIIIYGRQFVFRAEDSDYCQGQICGSEAMATNFIILNAVLAGFFMLLWFSIRAIGHSQDKK